MRSLPARLFGVWALALASACAVGFLLVQLYRESADAQLARAAAAAAGACERIGDSYAYYTTGWTPRLPAGEDAALRRDLDALVGLTLAQGRGAIGGIYQTESGREPVPLAFASPATSPGKSAEPVGEERARIAALNEAAAQSDAPEADRIGTGADALLLQACPLHGPLPGVTGWVAVRVAAIAGSSDLLAGVGVLLALVLALAAALGWLVLRWGRHVQRIEAALAAADAGELPPLPLTGEAELDRIVAALNTAGERLAQAHRRSEELSARVASSERLAALGRVAAGVAHEIRNPIAAMRLRAENALAGDEARRRTALEAILAQIARLDRLIAELLAMTQRREPQPEAVDVAALLAAIASDHQTARLTLAVDSPARLPALLDPALLRRTLDALVDNALRHTPDGGTVTLRAAQTGETLRIEVADTGPGVAADLRQTLFEPFVTGRAAGTGLGLAIARELAMAQGARLELAQAGGDGTGAVFRLEIACPAS
jgi:signal transduction histidine kinase